MTVYVLTCSAQKFLELYTKPQLAFDSIRITYSKINNTQLIVEEVEPDRYWIISVSNGVHCDLYHLKRTTVANIADHL